MGRAGVVRECWSPSWYPSPCLEGVRAQPQTCWPEFRAHQRRESECGAKQRDTTDRVTQGTSKLCTLRGRRDEESAGGLGGTGGAGQLWNRRETQMMGMRQCGGRVQEGGCLGREPGLGL